MGKTIMVIDCHSICHAVKHKTKGLSYGGLPTGIVYGFLMSLLKLQEAINADGWVFAWDSPNRLRRKYQPEYKLNREEKTPEQQKINEVAMPQFDELRDEVLPRLGFRNVIQIVGYEADDVIAEVTSTAQESDFNYVVVARDNDLYQCLWERCQMYDHINKCYYTMDDFQKEWGFRPWKWAMVKAIAGCKGDNVPGVDGVGDKTAAKWVRDELGVHTQAYSKILANEQLIMNNVPVVHLPLEGLPNIRISAGNEFTMKEFAQLCIDYGFSSFMKDNNFNRWKEAFVGAQRIK